jgi:hypothetical protein
MKRIALVSLSALWLLLGCAEIKEMMHGEGHRARMHACNSAQCRVPVTVTSCRVDTPHDIDLRNAPDDVRVVWVIQGPGEFAAANGIDARGNPRFSGRSHSPKQFEWSFDNRAKSTRHKFDVNVTLQGAACATHDPFIMN